jgi:hypothetical protein
VQNSNVFVWYKRFKDGRKNVKVNEKSSRPISHRTDENVEKVGKLMHSDRRLSMRTMAMHANLDKGTVTCVEKGLNFDPTIGYPTMTMLHLTRRSL